MARNATVTARLDDEQAVLAAVAASAASAVRRHREADVPLAALHEGAVVLLDAGTLQVLPRPVARQWLETSAAE